MADLSEQRRALRLAQAAWVEASGAVRVYQAAIIRGAPPAELEALRARVHDLIDASLDHQSVAAELTKAILGG